jgi:Uma2 family endonuclease
MSTVATENRYTPENLLTMPDGDNYELVDGNLLQRKMSARSSYVAGEIFAFLRDYNRANHRGWVFPEGTSYQCFPNAPAKIRRPDTSFIPFGRFPGEELPDGHIRIVPTLAVEVTSPNDLVYEVDEKVEEFLAAGSRLVWVIKPANRTVEIHRPDGPGVILRAENELTGDDVLRGFRCRVADLFPAPSLVSPST